MLNRKKKCGIILMINLLEGNLYNTNPFGLYRAPPTEDSMNLVIGISRYILPFLTLLILIKCMLSLLLGHPKEKTYGYITDLADGERYPLNMWETSVGRSNSCDVVIGYDTVSRFQAVISRRIDGWYIYDLLSKSGILVNGEKIEKKAMISGGDRLTFGGAVFSFEIADDPVSLVGKRKGRRKGKKAPAPSCPRPTPKSGAEAEVFIDRKNGTYNLSGNYAPKTTDVYAAGYYDDEHRPELHFDKKNESLFTQMPSEARGAKDVYSNKINRNFEGQQVVNTPSASSAVPERRYTALCPTLFNRDTGEAFVLSGNRVTIGRSHSCDIRLDSPTVSRKHAQLVLYEDGWAIEDCGSAVGTFLSGSRVTEPQLLFDGDVIALGDERLYYSSKKSVH